jgi:hypothetical protein
MRIVLFLALLLVAAPAWSGDELIRFRQADGTLGLVDDDDKLPPGAVVLERTPLQRPSESPATTEDEAAPSADDGSAAADDDDEEGGEAEHTPGTFTIEPSSGVEVGAAGRTPVDPEAARANASLCMRYHLDSDCTEGDRQVAAGWCRRSNEARDLLDRAEEELELAQEEFDRCDDLSGSYYCSRLRLDAALSTFAKEEAAVERMGNECRKEDCLPGWTREGCEP